MTGRNGERGAVLVAVLMVLALLSLLGAGAMLSATLDTQATGNQKESRLAAYAAEASLDYAISRMLDAARDPADPDSFLPFATYIPDGLEHAVGTIPGLSDPIVDQYNLSYIVGLLPGQTEPTEVSRSTTDNAQRVLNYARGYIVTGIATNTTTGASERVKETVRILRRPLTQYLAFYEGDMNWRPQTATEMSVGGGRVHASGSIYIAPQSGIAFRNATTWNTTSTFAMTAGAGIRRFEELQEGGSAPSTGGGGTISFPNDKLADPAGVLTDHISAVNQATLEEGFMILVGGRPRDSIVRTGVDAMRSMDASALGLNGYYSNIASGIVEPRPGTDCFHISGTPPVISLTYWDYPPTGSTTVDVTDMVFNYETPAGKVKLVDAADPDSQWSPDALADADGMAASDADPPIKGSIVYSAEQPPEKDHAGLQYPAAGYYNPDYPGVLEMSDPREGMDVEFTVVDLQRLECWYRDFLVENGIATGGAGGTFELRKLLVYATRPAGVNPLQAIKLIGSKPGRWRNTATTPKDSGQRQLTDTALAPTTFATNLPLYIEGDFSSTGASAPGGKPIVVLADSVTVLSNQWGVQHYNKANPGAITPAWETAYNAAFFAGRGNYATTGSGPAEGVENLLRLMENWSGVSLYATGSLNSLWYSTWAAGEFDEGVFVPPADYRIGWNTQFEDLAPDLSPQGAPPYVPSVYLVDRESWQEE